MPFNLYKATYKANNRDYLLHWVNSLKKEKKVHQQLTAKDLLHSNNIQEKKDFRQNSGQIKEKV